MKVARILNYPMQLLIVLLFVWQADSFDQFRIIVSIVVAFSLSWVAFRFNFLSLDGFNAAVIVGVITFGIGGWISFLLMSVFFVFSSLLSLLNNTQDHLVDASRRDATQVWANAFWFSVVLLCYFIWESDWIMVIAASVLATAAADTWATEVGTWSKKSSTYLITTFKRVPKGVDGGISLPGSIASLFGSLSLAMTYFVFIESNGQSFWIIFISGFVGCILDSLLGALFQKSSVSQSNAQRWKLDNNMVNLISTGLGGVISLALIVGL